MAQVYIYAVTLGYGFVYTSSVTKNAGAESTFFKRTMQATSRSAGARSLHSQ